MDLAFPSLDIYAVAFGAILIFAVILAAASILMRRGHPKPENDGHFHWAQAEMTQIAAERSPELRQGVAGFDAAILGSDLVYEARRLIAQVSNAQPAGPKVNVEEALARGLGETASNGLRRRLSSHLERLEPTERRLERDSRFRRLRRALDAEFAPEGVAQLEGDGRIRHKAREIERVG